VVNYFSCFIVKILTKNSNFLMFFFYWFANFRLDLEPRLLLFRFVEIRSSLALFLRNGLSEGSFSPSDVARYTSSWSTGSFQPFEGLLHHLDKAGTQYLIYHYLILNWTVLWYNWIYLLITRSPIYFQYCLWII